MSLSFTLASNDKKQEWDDFVDQCELGDILQYWEWGEVKREEGWDPLRVQVLEEGQVLLQAQILVKQAGFLGTYAYIPHGPLAKSNEILKAILPFFTKKIKDLAVQEGWFVIEVEPKIGIEKLEAGEKLWPNLEVFTNKELFKSFRENGFVATGRNMQPKYKLFYDLSLGEDELLQSMKKNTRYNVRLAERKGVKVHTYLPDHPQLAEKLEDFYKALEAVQDRAQGYPIRPFSSFKRLFEEFNGKNNLVLFEVTYKEDTVAYNISEFTGKWSSSFYAGSYRIHNKVKAPYLLRWSAVMEAKSRGIPIYDFWGIIPDSDLHKGYSDNKLSFGGQRIDYYGLLAYPINLPKYWIWHFVLPLRQRMYALMRNIKR